MSRSDVKSETRRAVNIDALADHVLTNGLAASSLRPLAQAAGVSDRMLLYYFKDKAEIMASVLATIAARLTLMLGAATASPLPVVDVRTRLFTVLLSDSIWLYMRIWLEMAALAAKGDPIFDDVGERTGRGFYAWGLTQIAAATPEAQAIDAARLLVMIEGLVLLKSIGMMDVARLAE